MFNNIRIEKINLAPIWATNFFLEVSALQNVRIVSSCNLVQYQAKLMMQLSENGKNPNFELNLGAPNFFPWVSPLLVAGQCSKLLSYAISWKSNELILGKILAQI